MLVGPAMVGLSVPVSLWGNAAWRDACGPTSRARDCRPGTTLSMTARAGNGVLFGSAALFLWIGGKRLGVRHALRDYEGGRAWIDTKAFAVGGGVLAGFSAAAMVGMRAYFWQVTPRCSNYACVQGSQNMATLTMSGLALSASIGAALVGYGRGYRRQHRLIDADLTLLPHTGRRFTGLSLRGRF